MPPGPTRGGSSESAARRAWPAKTPTERRLPMRSARAGTRLWDRTRRCVSSAGTRWAGRPSKAPWRQPRRLRFSRRSSSGRPGSTFAFFLRARKGMHNTRRSPRRPLRGLPPCAPRLVLEGRIERRRDRRRRRSTAVPPRPRRFFEGLRPFGRAGGACPERHGTGDRDWRSMWSGLLRPSAGRNRFRRGPGGFPGDVTPRARKGR